MSNPPLPSIPLPAIPPHTSVLDDLPCRSCGYNLRTLPTTGICPECATPVAASMRSELLRDADPNWLHLLNVGCKFEFWGIWIAWIFYIFGRMAWSGLTRIFSGPFPFAMMAIGTWLLTIPDPSGIGENRYGRLRVWARALGVAQFFATLAVAVSFSAPSEIFFFLVAWEILLRIGWGLTLLLFINRFAVRTKQSPLSYGFRVRGLLFVGFYVLDFVTWLVPIWTSGFRIPLIRFARLPFSWFALFFLYGAFNMFAQALRSEVIWGGKRTSPTLWRTAGAFLYSAGQLFRRKNGSDT